jgi:hypothetical protein
MKGGLKGVIDASFNVGSGIANRAGAMYESFKMGLTTNLFMRGLGLSRQQIYEDTHPDPSAHDEIIEHEIDAATEEDIIASMDDTNRLNRIRSNSDPAHAFSSDFRYKKTSTATKGKSSIRKSPPIPLPTTTATPYSQGAQKLKLLNVTGRVDYCVQEGLLENPYLSAFSAHMQYWQVRQLEIYRLFCIFFSD